MNRKTLLGDPPMIHITGKDFHRLDVLLAALDDKSISDTLQFLHNELIRARVVEDPKPTTRFVQIGSRVLFKDEQGNRYRLTLALPGQTGLPRKISILTPAGAALLGLSEGQSISYETPDKRIKTITVLRVFNKRMREAEASSEPNG